MKYLIVVMTSLFSSLALAQGHRIEFEIKNYEHSTCYIAFYYGDNNYILDTLDRNEGGTFVMEGPKDMERGVYTLATNEKIPILEFLISEQQFTLTLDASNPLSSLTVVGSKENEVFRDYRQYLTSLQKTGIPIRKRLDSLDADAPSRSQAEDSLKDIEDQFSRYKQEFLDNNKEGFWASIVRAQGDPKVPEFPKLEDGKRDSVAEYQWLKKHYFDYIDFGDLRYIHSPILNQRVKQYLDIMVVQNPDSVINEIDFLLNKSKAHPDIFKFMCITLFKRVEDSNVMGMDAAYVYLINNYYTAENITWVNEAGLKEIRERAEILGHLLIGKKAPDLQLLDADDKWHNLHEFQAKFTILFFWDSQCHKCQEVTDSMIVLYPNWKKEGIDVFGVNTEAETELWVEYAKEKQIPWLNVSDNQHDTFKQDLRVAYDVYDTPIIYVLDQDKKILAKKLDLDKLEEYIEKVLLKEKG